MCPVQESSFPEEATMNRTTLSLLLLFVAFAAAVSHVRQDLEAEEEEEEMDEDGKGKVLNWIGLLYRLSSPVVPVNDVNVCDGHEQAVIGCEKLHDVSKILAFMISKARNVKTSKVGR